MFLLVLEPAERAFCGEDSTEADGDSGHDTAVPARVVPVGVRVACRNGDKQGVCCGEETPG